MEKRNIILKLFLLINAFFIGCTTNTNQCKFIPAYHPAIYYDNVIEFSATREKTSFDRPLHDTPYHVDSPCTTITILTDSRQITAHIEYPAKSEFENDYTGPEYLRSYGSVGNVLINGKPYSTFDRPSDSGGLVDINISKDIPAGIYELQTVLPYGDKVYFKGFTAYSDIQLKTIPPYQKPRTRYVAYGDSITHGFYASDAIHTYPYLVAKKKDWRLISMGYAGRCATATDGPALVALKPDVLTILLGVNDCLKPVPIEQFKKDYKATVQEVLKNSPETMIYAITPLNIPGYRKGLNEDIEPYRQCIREIVAEINSPNLKLIEGQQLVPNEYKYFPHDGIHPGDLGFTTIAENLVELFHLK